MRTLCVIVASITRISAPAVAIACRSAVTACAVLFGTASVAVADPLQITGGFVTLYGDGVATMGIQGQNFSAAIVQSGGGSQPFLQLPVGSVAEVNFQSTVFTAAGVASMDGDQIRDESHPLGFIQLVGDFSFDVEPFTVADSGDLTQRFTPEFTLTGVLSGRTQAGAQLFSFLVFGSGSADLLFRRLELEDGVVFSSLPSTNMSFTFETAEAPVPEPASMLLLGSGLAGIALTRSRARR